jgi:hypothetical protein
LDNAFICCVIVIRVHVDVFWSLRAEEVDGVRDMECGYPTTVDVQALSEAFLSAFAKLRKVTISASSCLSVHPPHETTKLPLDGFSRNLI